MPQTEWENRNEDSQTIKILTKEIIEIKEKWGSRLCILGHYYQRPEILAVSDELGDSFKLSRDAATRDDCDVIVFCGVHFMAETADILANAPNRLALRYSPVQVLLPNPQAGCPMAEMATLREVESAWNELEEQIDINEVVPVTYVNSSAALKSFCGTRGGFACTSSNAEKVLKRAFSEKKRVFFLPDEHLGRNTSLAMGIPRDEIILWNNPNSTMLAETATLESNGFLPAGTAERALELARKPLGGNSPETVKNAKVVLWRGFCPVHQRFRLTELTRFRDDHPKGKIVVHPECREEVVSASDRAGSTKLILDLVAQSKEGSEWAIGTERHMVDSLTNGFRDRTVLPLSEEKPICHSMDMISLTTLHSTLTALEEGKYQYPVQVSESIAAGARLALNRMLECQ